MHFTGPISIFALCLIFLGSDSFAQNCNCDSLLNSILFQSMKRVHNSDSVKFINFHKKGVIKSFSEKEKILKLLTADSAWIPFFNYDDSATTTFVRLEVIAGRRIHVLDGIIIDSVKLASLTREETTRLVIIEQDTKAKRLEYFAKSIAFTDEYFEVYFSLKGRMIMSPTVCIKSGCYMLDNIITYFIFKK